MTGVPSTSTTLLRDIADSQHARWAEFFTRYRPMMEAYVRRNFPFLDADEVLQQTFVALVSALPDYVYNPKETGYFHNYLTGVLRHRALRLCRSRKRREHVQGVYLSQRPEEVPFSEKEEEDWKESLYEIALQQLLADKTVQGRTKQVFIRVAVNDEKPDEVAAAFRIERNAVDQIKSRMMGKLRVLVAALENADRDDFKTNGRT